MSSARDSSTWSSVPSSPASRISSIIRENSACWNGFSSSPAKAAASSRSSGIGSAITMCVRSIRGRASAADPEVLVGALRAEPEREGRDLRAPGVDVHAVEVVLDDQRRCRLAKLRELGVVRTEGPAGQRAGRGCVTGRPRLLVDREQEVERVQEEVAGATGRIQDPQVPRVLAGPRPERLVDRPDEVLAATRGAWSPRRASPPTCGRACCPSGTGRRSAA